MNYTVTTLDAFLESTNTRLEDYTYHHKATRRGYVSRKTREKFGTVSPYKGKFGTGFIVFSPNFDSTGYCYISYYILNK